MDPRQPVESMKRLFVLLLIFSTLTAAAQYRNDSSYSSLGDSETVTQMKERAGFLSSAMLEGRKAGSEGERQAAQYVSEILSSGGLDVLSGKDGEIFGIRQDKGDTLTSRNVIAYIPGYDKTLRNHYIVIGARLDNLGTVTVNVNGEKMEKIFYGANGNASGLAVLMQLASMLNTNKVMLKRSLIIAAFGSSLESGAGAWYFLNRSFKDVKNIDAMINLDILGTGSRGFYAYTASNDDLNKVMAIGFGGIILGIILGFIGYFLLDTFDIVSLPADVYGSAKLPLDLAISDFFSIIIGAMIIVFLSSYYPASRATKIDVIDVLRNE